jgi:hypothetical protein
MDVCEAGEETDWHTECSMDAAGRDMAALLGVISISRDMAALLGVSSWCRATRGCAGHVRAAQPRGYLRLPVRQLQIGPCVWHRSVVSIVYDVVSTASQRRKHRSVVSVVFGEPASDRSSTRSFGEHQTGLRSAEQQHRAHRPDHHVVPYHWKCQQHRAHRSPQKRGAAGDDADQGLRADRPDRPSPSKAVADDVATRWPTATATTAAAAAAMTTTAAAAATPPAATPTT